MPCCERCSRNKNGSSELHWSMSVSTSRSGVSLLMCTFSVSTMILAKLYWPTKAYWPPAFKLSWSIGIMTFVAVLFGPGKSHRSLSLTLCFTMMARLSVWFRKSGWAKYSGSRLFFLWIARRFKTRAVEAVFSKWLRARTLWFAMVLPELILPVARGPSGPGNRLS